MKPFYKRLSTWLPLIILASGGAGLWIGSKFSGRGNGGSLDKLQNIASIIEANYVDSVDIDSLIEYSLSDILAKLDPHTTYISANDLQVYNEDIEGSFSGIGIKFNMITDTIIVDEVISGGPSEKIGLLAGDRIITVDDSIVAGKGWTNERIIKSLRGAKGSKVKLGVKRDGASKLLDFTVTRDDIPVSSIDACYMITDNIGYLKINKFTTETFGEFITSMATLRGEGAQKYILDLRGNGGGLLQAAVAMANEFLDMQQLIVSMKGRKPEYNAVFEANGLGSFKNEELVVLLDEISASASEIVAGAIQDNDRGLIIGRRSFGKGLVQTQIELPDSSAIRLTVARYYTPSGRCIQKSYTLGNINEYMSELSERYRHGEGFSADSMRIDKSQVYYTIGGREVYGGGGIVPDIYVANDTTGISDYYISVFNAGLLQKFSFSYTDANRKYLSKAKTPKELIGLLPSDEVLLDDFVAYCLKEGNIAPRWYYINQSRDLIVSILKALIARDVLGTSAYYEVINQTDTTVTRAISELNK
ncbi:MAG: S41 family peptidase [Bacteroides sp.]|nr:S41 family peptidase [Bacteroides sp.]MCM1413433.1 S41 family peptidase [Bacteroides sp.]MCM1471356.1 S41 family peptidase [Bacteroides sp.]